MQNRTDSRAERTRATRILAWSALAFVSLIAGIVSYLHSLAVVRLVGTTGLVAYLIPFLADFVILGASAALIDAARERAGRPKLAMVALVAGIGVTAVMNVAAGWAHGAGGAVVAGWPAVAFILALECLAGIAQHGRGNSRNNVSENDAGHGEPPTIDEALAVLVAAGSRREVAAALGVPKSRVDTWAARAAGPAGEAINHTVIQAPEPSVNGQAPSA